ncbi:ankyrin repeat domain-containing protein [Aspergillus lucknowensis]|uniref:NACHT domain-containing protein n=1 Tax=Aspergillus lucknowensis TaxID=176173 RepID=A0ABR4M309_9EURO
MSFGYGAGDFMSLLLLANDIRRRFVYAPVQFKGTSESIKSLSNILRDIEDIDPGRVLSEVQRQHLADISNGCRGVLQDLQNVLSKYLDIQSADVGLDAFSRRVWQRLKWDPKEIQSFEQRIHAQVVVFTLFLSRLNLQVSLVTSEATAHTRTQIDAIKHYQTDEEYNRILDWLSPNNYAAQQNDFLSQQQEGSGQWLLGASQFCDWVQQDKATLFCPGIPGAGKTIMVSMIIDHLEQRFGNLDSIGVAYLYCSFRLRPTQTFRDLLASLVRQLVQGHASVPECVKEAYAQSRNKKTQPAVNELLEFLQLFSAQLSRVFVVVDALDECEATARESLLAAIYSLQDRYNVNLLATSRYIPDTIAAFESSPSLEIRASMEDVWRYLRSQLSRLPCFVSRNKDLQCEIIAEVSKAVGGMFLLAKLHLDSLVGKRSRKAIQTALKSLPSGSNAYDSAYRTAMERIGGQVPDQREMAKQVLSWITLAGPLTTRELQHALAVEIGQPYLDEANISDVEDIVSVCAGLVIVDEQSNIFRLVHYTTQEYFERTWTEWFPNAQQNIAATCITYLSFDCFENCQVGHLDKYPLYRYAAQNWGRHGRIELLDQQLVLGFLESKQKASLSLHVLLEGRAWPIPDKVDGLHLATIFRLEKIVDRLIQNCYDVNLEDSLGRTSLSWAAGEGHASLAQELLDMGAARDSKDASRQTPLSWAAKAGHHDVVELLLKRGADIEHRDKNGQTPLSLAARHGQRAVVQGLLKAGAKTDSKDNDGQTALSWALLLEGGTRDVENRHVVRCAATTVKGDNESRPSTKQAQEGQDGGKYLGRVIQGDQIPCELPTGSSTSSDQFEFFMQR